VVRNEIKSLRHTSQHGHCPTPQDHSDFSHHYINGHSNGSAERANVALCFLRGTNVVYCMLSALHIRLQMVGGRDTIIRLLYAEHFERFIMWSWVSTSATIRLFLILPRLVDNSSTNIIVFNTIASHSLTRCVFNHLKITILRPVFHISTSFLEQNPELLKKSPAFWNSEVRYIYWPCPEPDVYSSHLT
jgi:hypothetical protein